MKVDIESRPSEVQINILPMIDVIFCILTFFILAAVGLTRQQVINLTLPTANTSVPVTTNAERIYVTVDGNGQVYIDRTEVLRSQLQAYLAQQQQVLPNATIVLYAATSARYEDVIEVLDILRSVGGDRVALATLPSGASFDPTQGRDPRFGNPNGASPQPFGNPLGQPGVQPGTQPRALPGTAPGTVPGAPTNPSFPTSPGGLAPASPSGAPTAPPASGNPPPTTPNSTNGVIVPAEP